MVAKFIHSNRCKMEKKNRKAWTMGMTTNKIKTLYNCMDSCCNLMVDYLNKHIENNENYAIEAHLV